MLQSKIENLSKEEFIEEITDFKRCSDLHLFFTKCSEFDIAQWPGLLLL